MLKNIPTKSVLVVLALGMLVGFAIVGGFNTFARYTSTIEFCGTTCHEMRIVYEEYMDSPLYENNPGFRVTCADCHVPKPLIAKLWRKLKASRELYHKVVGTIDTPEKFEARRLLLARNEWRRLEQSDSRECRDCHFYEAMTIDTQPNDARFWHPTAMDEGYTCIDCHKGFVHRLPDLKGEIERAAEAFEATLAADALTADVLYVTGTTDLRAGPNAEDTAIATLSPGTPLTVLARRDEWIEVRIRGRQYQANHRALYKTDSRMAMLAAVPAGSPTTDGAITRDSATGLVWRVAEIEGWVSREGLTSQLASLWDYGKVLYRNECMRCHVVFSPSDFWATEWKHYIHNMRRKTDLTAEQMNILLRYLQHHAKPQGEI